MSVTPHIEDKLVEADNLVSAAEGSHSNPKLQCVISAHYWTEQELDFCAAFQKCFYKFWSVGSY